uniref:translocation and assembly module lipoprotein TamL n=1 Tax=Alistipes sp. TaxID=1872444 RepID=UPI004057B8F9
MMVACYLLAACSVTRNLGPGEYYLQQVEIHPDKETPRNERISAPEFKKYLRQRPNKRLFGINIYTGIYSLANPEKENGWNNFKRKLGEAPVIMEQELVERSADNFKNFMDSRGYFTSEVKYQIDTTRRAKRAYITFDIHQGKPYRISGLKYEFRDSLLGPIILADTAHSLIRTGEIFDIATLSAERERITQHLKNKGYYDFSVAGIEYLADTLQGDYSVGLTLIVKQNLQGYNERGEAVMGENVRYRIDEVNVFPQYDPLTPQQDSLFLSKLDTISYRGINIIYEGKPNLRKKVVRELIPIYQGFLYSADRISRTYDNLMSIGYFKSAKIAFVERPRQSEIIDTIHYIGPRADSTTISRSEEGFLQCNILCTPALKQSFKIELEGSITSSFYGLSATVGYQNRNIFRGAEALDLSFTAGYEYMRAPDAKKRNATEFGISAGLSFPRFLLPFYSKSFQTLGQPRTKVSVSVNFQDRPYYRRTLSNASWGYSWSYHDYSSFSLRPADITVVDVSYLDNDFFESLQNSYLQNSYRSQLISALTFSYTYNNQRKNLGGNATVFRLNAEVAGNLLDLAEHLFSKRAAGEDYYEIFGIRYSQYFRIDASISRKIMLGEKTAIAGRLYAGAGLAYGNAEVLPMDRLFYAGGSNSMRGWTPRTLGPGTTPLPKDMLYPTQLGDMRLEANLEFRFPIWGIFHGATFLDAGNIWFMRRNDEEYSPDAVFHFKDFYKGLGFNTGVGIRLDIKFAVLRLDWGIQLHSPNEPAGQRWIHDFNWDKMALNFGVGYPF